MEILTTFQAVASGMCFMVGITVCAVYVGFRQSSAHGLFGLLCISVGATCLGESFAYRAESLERYLPWLRLQQATLSTSAILFAWFTARFSRLERTAIPWACTVAHGGYALSIPFSRIPAEFGGDLTIARVALPWGEAIQVHAASYAPLGIFLYGVFGAVLAYGAAGCLHLRRIGRRLDAHLLGLSLAGAAAWVGYAAWIDVAGRRLPYLAGISILPLLVHMGIALGNEVRRAWRDALETSRRLVLESQERRKAEEARARADMGFRELLERSPVATMILDARQRMLLGNQKYHRVFGYTVDEVPDGRAWCARAYPDAAYRTAELAEWRSRVEEARRAGAREIGPQETRITCKDGTVRDVRVTMSILDERYLVVLDDVTEMLRVREELRQAQKLEAVGRIAGGIAHDFNNLLQVIVGQAALASRFLGPGDLRPRPSIRKIAEAAERCADLTRRLLAVGRVQILDRRAIDLGELVEARLPSLRRSLGAAVALRFGRGASPARVVIDPDQVERALETLCANARDAMPEGGALEIGVRGPASGETPPPGKDIEEGRYAVLTVEDEGRGMDDRTRERVFEPFFSTKGFGAGAGAGAGLGLASVYGTVKQHGGSIAVESMPGRGTKFSLYLPTERPRERREVDLDRVPSEREHFPSGVVSSASAEAARISGLHKVIHRDGAETPTRVTA